MKAMRKNDVHPTDFGFLYGLIPNKPSVVPCDIDMIYELNKHFLIGEWKNKNEHVSLGQKYMLQALANQPKTTVIIIRGISDGEHLAIGNFYLVTLKGTCEKLGFGEEGLKQYILSWYNKIKG